MYFLRSGWKFAIAVCYRWCIQWFGWDARGSSTHYIICWFHSNCWQVNENKTVSFNPLSQCSSFSLYASLLLSPLLSPFLSFSQSKIHSTKHIRTKFRIVTPAVRTLQHTHTHTHHFHSLYVNKCVWIELQVLNLKAKSQFLKQTERVFNAWWSNDSNI